LTGRTKEHDARRVDHAQRPRYRSSISS
jgi:hypothetical protein